MSSLVLRGLSAAPPSFCVEVASQVTELRGSTMKVALFWGLRRKGLKSGLVTPPLAGPDWLLQPTPTRMSWGFHDLALHPQGNAQSPRAEEFRMWELLAPS